MRISNAKRNAVRRLKRAVAPHLYSTGIVDDSHPTGCMQLCLFQHVGGLKRDPGVRPIAGNYVHARGVDSGEPIETYHGFAADAIVDDVWVGITLYPFHLLPLSTIETLIKTVKKLPTADQYRARLEKETACPTSVT